MHEILKYNLLEFGKYSLSIAMIVMAAAAFIAAKILIAFIKKMFERNTKKNPENEDRHHSFFVLLKYLVWVVSIIFILESLDIQITFLLAGSAALLVGVGLGIQETFNNLLSGIIILLEGSLKKNDVVEVDGLVGKVEEINLRTSVIYTRSGIYIIVPNHKFINENVINWSHHSKATRFQVEVGVAYGSDEVLVKNILHECLMENAAVIKNDEESHPMYVRIVNFGDSAIEFEVLFWSKDIFYIENTKSDLRFEILKKFRENEIVIPFPQRDVHVKSSINESREETK
jgi:small-conductance mechanosensitive channel